MDPSHTGLTTPFNLTLNFHLSMLQSRYLELFHYRIQTSTFPLSKNVHPAHVIPNLAGHLFNSHLPPPSPFPSPHRNAPTHSSSGRPRRHRPPPNPSSPLPLLPHHKRNPHRLPKTRNPCFTSEPPGQN